MFILKLGENPIALLLRYVIRIEQWEWLLFIIINRLKQVNWELRQRKWINIEIYMYLLDIIDWWIISARMQVRCDALRAVKPHSMKYTIFRIWFCLLLSLESFALLRNRDQSRIPRHYLRKVGGNCLHMRERRREKIARSAFSVWRVFRSTYIVYALEWITSCG